MSATTNTPANALIVKQKTFKDLIEKAKSSIVDILPKHLSADRMARTMLLAMTRQPLLYECSVELILQAFLTCSELGLEPGGIRGYMYLVPFWNSRIKGYECQTIPGYRGLMHLARNSMEVSYFAAHVVHANDKFKAVYGLHEDLIHEPCMDDNPGMAVGVYAVAHMKSGEKQFEVMTRSQVEAIRSRSKSRDKNGGITGPWVTDTDEMWRKTAIRRLMKYVELSEQMEKAIEIIDSESDMARDPKKGSVDMVGMLNAPRERVTEVDVGQICPAEQAWNKQEGGGEALPWQAGPDPEKQPSPEVLKTPQKIADRISALERQYKEQGITREVLEKYIGIPIKGWTEAILQALEGALERMVNGSTPQEEFPEMYGENGEVDEKTREKSV